MLRREGENIRRSKAFWHFAETRDCKFSRPPRYDRFDIPAYIWCGLLHHIYAVLYRVARETCFTNPLRIPDEDAPSSLVSSK